MTIRIFRVLVQRVQSAFIQQAKKSSLENGIQIEIYRKLLIFTNHLFIST